MRWRPGLLRSLSYSRIHYNFVKPHSALEGQTPAQVAGVGVEAKNKWMSLLEKTIRPSLSPVNGLRLSRREKDWALSEREWRVWAAAWIDTEGTINATQTPVKNGIHPYSYPIKLTVYNFVKEPLALLRKHFGGRLYNEKVSKTSEARQDKDWQWRTSRVEVYRVIGEVFPFLIAKKKEAFPIYHFLSREIIVKGRPFTEAEYEVGRLIFSKQQHRAKPKQ